MNGRILAGLPAISSRRSTEEECMAPRKRNRALERILPADRDAPLDPAAAHRALARPALTAHQARALVGEANKRARRAAVAREKQHREVMRAIARGDWPRAGALHAAEQERMLEPIVTKAGEAALAERDLAKGRQLGGAWNAARRRKAARQAQRYARLALALRRKKGDDWPVSSIIAHIRRTTKNPLGIRQIRRDLAARGIT
jgi:hypothetical protein